MSKNIDWVFAPRSPSQSAVGDYIPGKILQSRRLNEISIYAREGGQNTKNQPLDENKPVNVEVKLIELTGNSLKEYLKNLQWDKLKKHIQACSSVRTQSSFSVNLKNALNEINNNKKSNLQFQIGASFFYNKNSFVNNKNADLVLSKSFFACKPLIDYLFS